MSRITVPKVFFEQRSLDLKRFDYCPLNFINMIPDDLLKQSTLLKFYQKIQETNEKKSSKSTDSSNSTPSSNGPNKTNQPTNDPIDLGCDTVRHEKPHFRS